MALHNSVKTGLYFFLFIKV